MPRAGLSHDAVVALALAEVDAHGFAALSLAGVAQRAGVATPSLYKHVGSLGALRRAVAVVAVDELTAVVRTATSGLIADDAVRALARSIRAWARARPGRYAAAQVAADPDDPHERALAEAGAASVDVVLDALRGYGLPADRRVDAVRAVRSAVHGFVVLELGSGFRLPADRDRSFDALVDMLLAGVRALAQG